MGSPPRIAPRPFDLEEATIPSLQAWMAEGRLTARSLVEAYPERIEEVAACNEMRPCRDSRP